MRTLRTALSGASAFVVLALTLPASAARGALPAGFSDQLVASGLDLPVGMAFLPDGRLFVAERWTGRVRLLVDGAIAAVDPVLMVDSLQLANPEQGLLGVAVDPGFPSRPFLYVFYDYIGAPRMLLRRYTLTGDLALTGNGALSADPGSEFQVLVDVVDQNGNHNGGTLRFGPDGMLYVALGDDLLACPAQDLTRLYGKILRLDVSQLPPGPGGPPPYALLTPADNPFVAHTDPRARLVWQFGLRNPWSFHFDPVTGAAFIADVGVLTYEEIDLADQPGLNFGWPLFEGPMPAVTCDETTGGFSGPIHWYDRRGFANGAAVISAGVYRAPSGGSQTFPADYEGDYFFSDLGEGFLRRLKWTGSAWALAPPAPGQPNPTDWGTGYDFVTHYLEAPDGSIWYLRYAFGPNGQVRRIAYDATTSVPAVNDAKGIAFAVRPTPSRGPVSFTFTLASAEPVHLAVFDVSGRWVRELIRETRPAGRHDARWDGLDRSGAEAPAGLYLAVLRAGTRAVSVRVPLLR